MVPRRTKMVTKPHRMVILMLFIVLAIWRPWGPRRRLEVEEEVVVGRVPLVETAVGLFWAVKPMIELRDLKREKKMR